MPAMVALAVSEQLHVQDQWRKAGNRKTSYELAAEGDMTLASGAAVSAHGVGLFEDLNRERSARAAAEARCEELAKSLEACQRWLSTSDHEAVSGAAASARGAGLFEDLNRERSARAAAEARCEELAKGLEACQRRLSTSEHEAAIAAEALRRRLGAAEKEVTAKAQQIRDLEQQIRDLEQQIRDLEQQIRAQSHVLRDVEQLMTEKRRNEAARLLQGTVRGKLTRKQARASSRPWGS